MIFEDLKVVGKRDGLNSLEIVRLKKLLDIFIFKSLFYLA